MAKYDDKRTRNDKDYYKGRGEDIYSNAAGQVQSQGSQFGNDYNEAKASDKGLRDDAAAGFREFSATGGISPSQMASMRSRAFSPIRAAYSDANRNIERSYAMGGSTAGANVLRSRLARESGQAASDSSINTEAGIADMVAHNRLSGLGGLAGLYGTAPGNTAMQAGNVLQNMNQGLGLVGMENNRMQGLLDTQLALTRAPGNTDKALQWAGEATDIGRKIFHPSGGIK